MKSKTTNLVIAAFALLFLTNHSYAKPYDIEGSVLYHQNQAKPIPTVDLKLYSLTDNSLIGEAVSRKNGTYTFANVPYGKYKLTASTSIKAGGVTMGDAVLMFLHLNRLYPFNEVQKLASDLNHDGEVTWDDYSTLVVGWFVQGYPFQPDWVFQDLIIDHSGLKTSLPPMGGSSSGDVNGTFVPTTRNEEIVDVTYTEKYFTPEFKMDVYANDITSASGMGIVIDFPNMVNVNSVTCQLEGVNMNISASQIRISWINESFIPASIDPSLPLLIINGKVNEKYNGTDIKFTINNLTEFSDFKGDKINTSFSMPILTSGEFLGNNYPNPFIKTTTINFYVPETAMTTLLVYNQKGQMVRSLVSEELSAGPHVVIFNAEGLNKGVYYYTLRSSDNINQTKKLVILN